MVSATFQFDAAWKKTLPGDVSAQEFVESLAAEPQVMINSG
jgi:hypothetical protein